MIIRPGEGRSDAPSTAIERGRRRGARSITAAEELTRGLRQRFEHVGVDSTMPGDELARVPPSPTLVDEAIDRLDVEAAHLGEATLAANDTKRVLLPVEDVRERILHGPRI